MAAEAEALGPDPWLAFSLAVLYSTLGDKDNAFRWLNYEHIHCWAIGIRILRPFASLREDPRYLDLLEKMNLPL